MSPTMPLIAVDMAAIDILNLFKKLPTPTRNEFCAKSPSFFLTLPGIALIGGEHLTASVSIGSCTGTSTESCTDSTSGCTSAGLVLATPEAAPAPIKAATDPLAFCTGFAGLGPLGALAVGAAAAGGCAFFQASRSRVLWE